jgi:lactoylglutathione lyase
MILGIGHSAFGARDLEASLSFYIDQLGLEKAFELHRGDGSLWLVYLYCGDGSFIELFPEDEVTERSDLASYKHLCLRVDDMSLTLDDLAQRGLNPLNPPSVGKDGNTQAWLEDPDGNLIELMQIDADSDQGRIVAQHTS